MRPEEIRGNIPIPEKETIKKQRTKKGGSQVVTFRLKEEYIWELMEWGDKMNMNYTALIRDIVVDWLRDQEDVKKDWQ